MSQDSYYTICPWCNFYGGHLDSCVAHGSVGASSSGLSGYSAKFQSVPVKCGPVTEDEVKLLMANEGQVYGPRAKYSQRIKSMLETFAKSRGLM